MKCAAAQVLGGPHAPSRLLVMQPGCGVAPGGFQHTRRAGSPSALWLLRGVLLHGARAAKVHFSKKGNDPSHRQGRPWFAGDLSCGVSCMLVLCQLRAGRADVTSGGAGSQALLACTVYVLFSSAAGTGSSETLAHVLSSVCLQSHARLHAVGSTAVPPLVNWDDPSELCHQRQVYLQA